MKKQGYYWEIKTSMDFYIKFFMQDFSEFFKNFFYKNFIFNKFFFKMCVRTKASLIRQIVFVTLNDLTSHSRGISSRTLV